MPDYDLEDLIKQYYEYELLLEEKNGEFKVLQDKNSP